MLSTLKRTKSYAVAYSEGKLTIIKLPTGKEDASKYTFNGVSMKRVEIVTDRKMTRGFAFLVEDSDFSDAVIYMLVTNLGEA